MPRTSESLVPVPDDLALPALAERHIALKSADFTAQVLLPSFEETLRILGFRCFKFLVFVLFFGHPFLCCVCNLKSEVRLPSRLFIRSQSHCSHYVSQV